MLERIVLTLAIIGLGLLGYALFNRLLLRRQAGRGLGLPEYHAGRPAVLYFTAPGCAPCRTVQRPALAALRERYGDGIQIIEVNAADSPQRADHWGVLSLPTTFIIDSGGQPRCVNHGTAGLAKLEQQLAEFSELPEPRASQQSARDLATTDVS